MFIINLQWSVHYSCLVVHSVYGQVLFNIADRQLLSLSLAYLILNVKFSDLCIPHVLCRQLHVFLVSYFLLLRVRDTLYSGEFVLELHFLLNSNF